MKKILALIIMIAGIFVSCGHKEESKSTKELLAEKSNTTDSATTDNTYPPVIEDMGTITSSTSKVEDPSKPENPKTYYVVTADEREMLATLVYLESSICSTECQRAVASVIFNRLDSGKWRKDMNKDGVITLYDIVYYPNAFTPSYLIEDYTDKTTQECYDAVDYVIMNGPTVPTEVRYFRTNYDFKWDNYANYCVMDNVYFGYFTNWKQGAW